MQITNTLGLSALLFVLFAPHAWADHAAWLVEGTVDHVGVSDGGPITRFEVGDSIKITIPLHNVSEDAVDGPGIAFDIDELITTTIDDRVVRFDGVSLNADPTLSFFDFMFLIRNSTELFINMMDGIEDNGLIRVDESKPQVDRFPTAMDLQVDRFEALNGGYTFHSDNGVQTDVAFQIDSFRLVPEPNSATGLLLGLSLVFVLRRRSA